MGDCKQVQKVQASKVPPAAACLESFEQVHKWELFFVISLKIFNTCGVTPWILVRWVCILLEFFYCTSLWYYPTNYRDRRECPSLDLRVICGIPSTFSLAGAIKRGCKIVSFDDKFLPSSVLLFIHSDWKVSLLCYERFARIKFPSHSLTFCWSGTPANERTPVGRTVWAGPVRVRWSEVLLYTSVKWVWYLTLKH